MRTLGGSSAETRLSPPRRLAPPLYRCTSHAWCHIAMSASPLANAYSKYRRPLRRRPGLGAGWPQAQPHETSPHFSATLGYSWLLSRLLSATLGPSLGYSRLPATLGYSLGPSRLLSSLAGRAEPLEALCDIRRGRLGRHLRDACARGRFREGSEKAPLRGTLTNRAFEEERGRNELSTNMTN